MKIQTLKDLKLALKDIPDEFLEDFGAGFSEDPFVELMVWCDEEEFSSKWDEAKKKYTTINDISKWIQNISRLSQKLDKEDEHCDTIGYEEPISSEDNLEDDSKKTT